MAQLRADVLAELTKLSTLAGDLVDIAGGDACGVVHELADMSDVIDRSLKRVRRRRCDIEFNVAVTGWQVYGDAAGLYRTVTNLLDNAVKWSPPDGHVSVLLKALRGTPLQRQPASADHPEWTTSSTPGIPGRRISGDRNRTHQSSAALDSTTSSRRFDSLAAAPSLPVLRSRISLVRRLGLFPGVVHGEADC
jgi:two-component system sensor histidine kinase MprB